MALETVSNIKDLVATNPVNATDDVSEGDDHIRNIKTALLTDLPNITGPITATQAEINLLDGATVTTEEINVIDAGATVTTPNVAGGDAFVMDDLDVGMVQVDIDNVDTYLAATTKTVTNKSINATNNTITNVGSAELSAEVSPWIQLDTITASASASVNFETGIDGTYSNYMITYVDVLPATDAQNLILRVGTGATPTYQSGATDYEYYTHAIGSDGVDISTSSTGDTSIALVSSASNAASQPMQGTLLFNNPANATMRKSFRGDCVYTSSPTYTARSACGGEYRQTTAITAVQFLMTSGAITSGVFTLYGLR